MSDILIASMESARDELVSTAQAVPDARLNWKPLDNGRTVLDLLGDAAQIPLMVMPMLGAPGGFKPSQEGMREMFGKMREERKNWTRDECLKHLHTNTDAVIAAIRALPEERLAEPLTMPFGGGMTMPMGAWVMMIHRAFYARMGQINYIQTLYGDFDPH